jgi:starch synthase
MKVLFATAELTPVVRVGGLAEAAAGLVNALRAAGIDVEVVLPDYGGIELTDQTEIDIEMPWWAGVARVRRGRHAAVGDLTVVHVRGIDRDHPYVDATGEGWPDNDARFMAFSAAVAGLAARDRPDLVHLNDWHTAAAVGMMLDRPPTMLTVHTLGYQGTSDRAWLDHLPVEAHRFAWYGGTNPLAGAIELVDRVVAVSPTYAREIVTPGGGMGLDERLDALGDRLVGIRNGIDTAIWDPAHDPHIAANYGAADRSGRARCRLELVERAGWTDDKTPVAAMVTRLVDQKGVDLLIDAARFLPSIPLRLVVLGAGEAGLAGELHALADANPEHVWFFEGYDEPLAHQLFAGGDLFVMPSRFEPCGLAQMQAMAYGAIPVVTRVGGLRDTVTDADADRAGGNGFTAPVDAAGLVDALHRGVRAVRHAGRRAAIQGRGMAADWSWDGPAAEHIALYRELSGR